MKKLMAKEQTVPGWAVPIEAVKQQIVALQAVEREHHQDLVDRLEKIDKNLDGRLIAVENGLQDKVGKSDLGQALVRHTTDFGELDKRIGELENCAISKEKQDDLFSSVTTMKAFVYLYGIALGALAVMIIYHLFKTPLT